MLVVFHERAGYRRRAIVFSRCPKGEREEASDEALSNLEKDHKFLLKGGVFTEDLIESWIGYKRSKEVDPMRLRPHPYEFFLYYDI